MSFCFVEDEILSFRFVDEANFATTDTLQKRIQRSCFAVMFIAVESCARLNFLAFLSVRQGRGGFIAIVRRRREEGLRSWLGS